MKLFDSIFAILVFGIFMKVVIYDHLVVEPEPKSLCVAGTIYTEKNNVFTIDPARTKCELSNGNNPWNL